MRTAPSFWWRRPPTAIARLLAPAGFLYGAVTALRMRSPGERLPVPVLCVGNLVVGGAGKTPTVLAVAEILHRLGQRPAALSRGYGRAPRGDPDAVIRVDPNSHLVGEVGDEPLLLARRLPTYVSRDRLASGRRAIADGASILLLDDGLQNPRLSKDLALAVVDGRSGDGNGHCIPAGPLRAPLAKQWPHVSGLVLIGPGDAGERLAGKARTRNLPVWQARLSPLDDAIAALRGRPVYGFAAIGRPEKFFQTLRDASLALAGTRRFPDHYAYRAKDLGLLLQAAEAAGARLVTTEKDAVRLPPGFPATPLPVTLTFDQPDEVAQWLATRIGVAARQPV